jgi:hypothetical protein
MPHLSRKRFGGKHSTGMKKWIGFSRNYKMFSLGTRLLPGKSGVRNGARWIISTGR